MKKIIMLKNDSIKCQQRFVELGGITNIEINSCSTQYANTTSGNKLPLNNIYTVYLLDRITNDKLVISFLCNCKNESHSYFKIIGLKKNDKNYSSSRYFTKYIQLTQEIVFAMTKQETELN